MKSETTQPEAPSISTVHSRKDEAFSDALTALRRFARARPDVERCDLCGHDLAPDHPHLLERKSKQIACACDACAILFCGQQAPRFVRIPRRLIELEHFAFDDPAWEAMMLPINLAFFIRQPDGQVTVMYPSPAGATSSLLALPPWHILFAGSHLLESLQPEVEALLVNRSGNHAAYLVVPVDECYRLVGLIRTEWRGLSGGSTIREAIAAFFSGLQSRASLDRERPHA